MAETAAPAAPVSAPVRRGNPTWRRLRRNKNVVFGTTIIALLVLLAIVGPWVTPVDPYAQDIWERYAAPRGLWVEGQWITQFVLGADELGRDLLSRLIIGARVSLMVGLIATVTSLVFGVFLGAISGYVGGWVDDVIMRVMDVILALPGILLAIAVVRIPTMARVVRSDGLAVREEEFVDAARALGQRPVIVLFKHVLMNAWAPALVLATLGMGTAIVAEAALSFLGLGAQPPQISWGRMLSVGREAIRSAPHVTLYPGIAITIVVLGFSLLGDGLRDVFDRRLKDG